VDLDCFPRQPDGTATPTASTYESIVRVETTQEADDGQQFRIWLLDADDSFDVVVVYPDGTHEIVWSVVRERSHA